MGRRDQSVGGGAAQLLAQGYALVGSSYDVNASWWALDTAVSDQFGSLAAFLPPGADALECR